MVCRSLQLGADDDRCVALASKWHVLRVDEIGYLLGDPRALLFCNLHPHSRKFSVYWHLVVLRGTSKAFPVANYVVGHWKDMAVVFCVFFRLDMLKYAGVTTN